MMTDEVAMSGCARTAHPADAIMMTDEVAMSGCARTTHPADAITAHPADADATERTDTRNVPCDVPFDCQNGTRTRAPLRP